MINTTRIRNGDKSNTDIKGPNDTNEHENQELEMLEEGPLRLRFGGTRLRTTTAGLGFDGPASAGRTNVGIL
jgi:hypothetical protein